MKTINDYLDELAEGCACLVDDQSVAGRLVVADVEIDWLQKQLRRPGWLGFVGTVMRPGVTYFARWLELHWFPPGTERNKLLELYYVRWTGQLWTLIMFPGAGVPVEVGLAEAGLRASEKGRPVAVKRNQMTVVLNAIRPDQIDEVKKIEGWMNVEVFPLEGAKVLENLPGDKVYKDMWGAAREGLDRVMRELPLKGLPERN
jgi:hypothetical protein